MPELPAADDANRKSSFITFKRILIASSFSFLSALIGTWLFAYPNMNGAWETWDDLEGHYCNIGPYVYGELINPNSKQKHFYEGYIELNKERAILDFWRDPPNNEDDYNRIVLNNLTDGHYKGVETWIVQINTINKQMFEIDEELTGNFASPKKAQEIKKNPSFSCLGFLKPANFLGSLNHTLKYWYRTYGSVPG